ncbi:hypothetical protein [Olsenella profusa]|uniref:Amino acid-binding protein n=1 Tax=Olsenella profusa TaxID=138595 RepID=A0ABS2F224_9ACTN|nr:hypothetical protein [Olsenella profusa]MBM6774865.1 amino acid-binding protein [Olsenella profusa]
MIDQLSVSLPNRPGSLAQMCRLLGEWGLQIHAFMVADTSDFSIVRIICDQPRTACARLAERGYAAITSRLAAVEVENVPGAFGALLERLASYDLNVEYAYCCSLGSRVVDLIKVSGEPLAVKLAQTGLVFLDAAELYVPDEEE